jgi:riboflavin kinase/FMN adenylyltransferase
MAIYSLGLDQPPPPPCRGGALTIGNFDGVHRGHVALLAALAAKAQALNAPAVALTFDPHPLELLRPEQFQPVLTAVPDRAELMQEAGATHVIVLRTTPELLQLSARQFFERVIRAQLDARCLVEGENFGFGHDREGSVRTLADLSREAGLEPPVIVPSLQVDGIAVSSSRVRAALVHGRVREAAVLLDRTYRLHGMVGTGQRRGRKLGFPTANLEKVTSLIPGDGVYAVTVSIGGGSWRGAASIGPNPTFGENARKVEAHILDFQGDLYGQTLAIAFVDRIRDIRSFAGVDQLVAQLRIDVEQARRLTEAQSP